MTYAEKGAAERQYTKEMPEPMRDDVIQNPKYIDIFTCACRTANYTALLNEIKPRHGYYMGCENRKKEDWK